MMCGSEVLYGADVDVYADIVAYAAGLDAEATSLMLQDESTTRQYFSPARIRLYYKRISQDDDLSTLLVSDACATVYMQHGVACLRIMAACTNKV
jgi:hypothetical protein